MNCSSAPERPTKPRLLPAAMVHPFVLVTILFPLWGFANDFTNPLVRVFKEIFLISNTQSSLVQFAFYGGYATMAIPAAIFIRRYTYKSGILVGLALYAAGALITIPAASMMSFNLFLVALYILTFGLAFLETTANPYILSMGPEETATQRLNLAQAFNPIGSLSGMMVASLLILPNLGISEFRDAQMRAHPEYQQMAPGEVDGRVTAAMEKFAEDDPEAFRAMKAEDLSFCRGPYIAVACVVILVLLAFLFSKLPDTSGTDKSIRFFETAGRLLKNPHYVGGVIAQTFYVGAQIMCWTFIVHYGMTNLKLDAATTVNYNMAAMGVFLVSRFICTFILKYLPPGRFLAMLAIGGCILTVATIVLPSYGERAAWVGLYCLVGISACMSLMFPTIYGIALDGLGEDAKLGSAGLIFAIVGGCLMPVMQGWIIDLGDVSTGMVMVTATGFGLSAVSASFVLPLICFVVIAVFGLSAARIRRS